MCVCVCVCACVRACVRVWLLLSHIGHHFSDAVCIYSREKFTIWFHCAPSIYVVSLTGVHTHTHAHRVYCTYIHAYTVVCIGVVLLLLGNRSVQLSVGL